MLWTGSITKWRSIKDWKVTEKYPKHNSKATNNIVSAKPQNSQYLEFNQLSIVESIFNQKCVFVAGILGWWYDFSDIEKAAVIGGPLLFIIILIIACCCCCGCCGSHPTATMGLLSSLPQLSLWLSWQQAPGTPFPWNCFSTRLEFHSNLGQPRVFFLFLFLFS